MSPTAGAWTLRNGRRQATVQVSGPLQANNSLALKEAALQGLGIARLPLFTGMQIRDALGATSDGAGASVGPAAPASALPCRESGRGRPTPTTAPVAPCEGAAVTNLTAATPHVRRLDPARGVGR